MSHSLLRKTGAGALAAVLVLGLSGGAVRAETPPHPPRPGLEEKGPKPAITRDEALARVKQYFAVPSEGVEIQIQLSKWARNPRWEIEVNDGRQYHQLASVDAVTGRVLSYSAYRPQSRQIYEGAIPVPAEGVPYREQAEALVKALAPAGVFERLRPAEETLGPAAEADGETHLGWVEYRNGAAVPFSSVSVTIDNATMAVVSYYYNVQDGVEYADGPAVITAKQARELLSSAVTPRLVYVPITDYFYDQPVRPEMKLQYWFPGAHRTLDALTGDLLGYADKELETTAADAVPAGAGAPVKAASLPLQEEEAMRLTRTLFGLSDDTELQIYGGKGRGSISVNWEGGSVAFSRETGLIQFAWRPNDGYGSMKYLEEQERTRKEFGAAEQAEARKQAAEIVQTYFSQYLETPDQQVRVINPPESGFDFFFQRYVNGIPVLSDFITVSIDPVTMQWQGIHSNWSDVTRFPSATEIVDVRKAADAFFGHSKVELVYQYPETWSPYGYEKGETGPHKANLVYQLVSESEGVDAHTGLAVTWGGEPVGAREKAAESLRGHWAEGALRHLLTRRVISAGELNPNAGVTRLQAVHMVMVRRPGGEFWEGMPEEPLPYTDVEAGTRAWALLSNAYREGWLKPVTEKRFQPDAPVTRAQFAVWMARAVQLGDLARSDLKVNHAYTDLAGLTAEEQNAVSFLRALGLLKPAEAFRGADTLTQAEGAVLVARVFNYLAQSR